jgi:hypothetical protein
MSALPGISDINLFRYCQGVIDLNAEIPDRAFDLGMPEQKLDGPEIARPPVDQGSFCTSQGMRPEQPCRRPTHHDGLRGEGSTPVPLPPPDAPCQPDFLPAFLPRSLTQLRYRAIACAHGRVEKTRNAEIFQVVVGQPRTRPWRATNDDDEQYCIAVAL